MDVTYGKVVVSLVGVLTKIIIKHEYQGIQHYQNTKYFGKYEREVTDLLKKDYCNSHNILLYEIKYNEDIYLSLERILKTLV